GEVTGATDFRASDLILKIRIAYFFSHFRGSLIGDKPESGRHPGHGVHLDPHVRDEDGMKYIPRSYHQQHRLAFRNHDILRTEIIQCIFVREVYPPRICSAYQTIVIFTELIVFAGIPDLPSKLIAHY